MTSDVPNYMVIDSTDGSLVYTDDGAAVEETLEDAEDTAAYIANWMGWNRGRLAVKEVILTDPY